jgi:hypothetical protein
MELLTDDPASFEGWLLKQPPTKVLGNCSSHRCPVALYLLSLGWLHVSVGTRTYRVARNEVELCSEAERRDLPWWAVAFIKEHDRCSASERMAADCLAILSSVVQKGKGAVEEELGL